MTRIVTALLALTTIIILATGAVALSEPTEDLSPEAQLSQLLDEQHQELKELYEGDVHPRQIRETIRGFEARAQPLWNTVDEENRAGLRAQIEAQAGELWELSARPAT